MTLEEIEKAISSSSSIAEAYRKLGISRQGMDYLLKKYDKKIVKNTKLELVDGTT